MKLDGSACCVFYLTEWVHSPMADAVQDFGNELGESLLGKIGKEDSDGGVGIIDGQVFDHRVAALTIDGVYKTVDDGNDQLFGGFHSLGTSHKPDDIYDMDFNSIYSCGLKI